MHVQTHLKGFAMGMLLLIGCLSTAFADHGPLQATNRFPLHLMFLKPRPVKADLPPPGGFETTLAVDYSNTYFKQANSRWDVLMDMEMLVVDFSIVYGLNSRFAFKVDLPLVSMNDGFLDEFLGDFHDFIGSNDYFREERPSNTFGYRVTKDSAAWIEGDSGASQLADATVSVQYALTTPGKQRKVDSSLLLSAKVPTGDEQRGFGSGAFDVGLYWPTQWRGKTWSYYLMPSIAVIGDPRNIEADVKTRNSYGIFGAVGYNYSERMTWVAQVNAYSSPLESTGISELDNGTVALDVGFHYQVKPDWIFEFVFSEDLTLAAPDFNVRLGIRWATRSW